jgi:hypothetical protein
VSLAFGRLNGFARFICWFHAIQCLGATAVAGSIMREIYRVASEEEWLGVRDVIASYIIGLKGDGNLANADKILAFIGFNGDGTWGVFEQAPWARPGVPLCNNHCEGAHRWYNTIDLQLPLVNRVDWMLGRIDRCVGDFGDAPHQDSINRCMNRTADREARLESCDCAIARRNAELWGVTRGACPHVRPFALEFRPMPALVRNPDIGWEAVDDTKPWKRHERIRPEGPKPKTEEREEIRDDLHFRLKRLARILQGVDGEHHRGFLSPSTFFLRRRRIGVIASDLRMLLTQQGITVIEGLDGELAYRGFCRSMIAAAAGDGMDQFMPKRAP